jgi:hypothetical protein
MQWITNFQESHSAHVLSLSPSGPSLSYLKWFVMSVCHVHALYSPPTPTCVIDVLYDRTGVRALIHLRFHSFRFNQKRDTNIDRFSYPETPQPHSTPDARFPPSYFSLADIMSNATVTSSPWKKREAKAKRIKQKKRHQRDECLPTV